MQGDLARAIFTTILKSRVSSWKGHDDTTTNALKLVAVVVKVPSAAAATGVEVSILAAMLVVPHGVAFDGFWTSFRTGAPETPRTGAIAACACACAESVTTMAASETSLENMVGIEG